MNIKNLSDGTDGRFYLALTDEPVGVLHVTPDEESWVIEHIYVAPPARRTGVGAALIAAATSDLGRWPQHDGRLSSTGRALLKELGVDRRPGAQAETLPDDVTEETGRKLLSFVAGQFS